MQTERGGWVLKFLAWVFRWELIYLVDFQKDVYLTHLKTDEFGKYCYIYWDTQVGKIRLNDDGTISEDSYVSYVDSWSPYNG